MSRNVVVVGGGPAGLAAAKSAVDAGARVTIIDSSDQLGGQFWRHLPPERAGTDEARLHHDWQTYQRLHRRLTASPHCEIRTRTQIWAIETTPDGVLLTGVQGAPDARTEAPIQLHPDALVLATGAHDRTLPFPGWTLPGVYTAGAAQAFAKAERVALGRRVLVAGAGPFLLPVTESLVKTGAKVVAVLEANRPRNLARWLATAPWKLAGKAGELTHYVGTHLRHRVPYRPGRAVVAAHGDDRVEAVTVARVDANWKPIPGTEKRYAVDAVCVSHGFTPRLELAVAAGCRLTADRFVRVDDAQQTTVRGVYAAGEITGIGGKDAALAEGAIAGHCAAGGDTTDAVIQPAVRRRRTMGAFSRRLDAAHGIRPGWTGWLTDDTILCRCEESRVGTVRRTVAATGSVSLRSTKLTTRVGLGICQARICGRNVEDYLGQLGDRVPAGDASSDHRPIVSPVRLGDIARLADPDTPTTP